MYKMEKIEIKRRNGELVDGILIQLENNVSLCHYCPNMSDMNKQDCLQLPYYEQCKNDNEKLFVYANNHGIFMIPDYYGGYESIFEDMANEPDDKIILEINGEQFDTVRVFKLLREE